jgi:protein-disulfide isomerase
VEINVRDQPVIGDPKAPVTLVEFGDFKCPSCKMFHDNVYPMLKKEYIDTGKVKMVFRNFQFIGQDSLTAGMIGRAIYKQKPDAFWKYYDLIYANQQNEAIAWATPEYILPLVKAEIPEVDTNKISQSLKKNTYQTDIVRDNQYAQALKIESVPTIYVNGLPVKQALDYNALKNTIEKELAK